MTPERTKDKENANIKLLMTPPDPQKGIFISLQLTYAAQTELPGISFKNPDYIAIIFRCYKPLLIVSSKRRTAERRQAIGQSRAVEIWGQFEWI